jgi:hypothetical protein
MEKEQTGAAIQIMQLIIQDPRQVSRVVIERRLAEESVRKIKVNITIATGKEIQTKIHLGQCGATLTPVIQTAPRARDGIIIRTPQPADKIPIGEIVLHEVQLIAAPEVVQQEAVLQVVHHLAAPAVDHIRGVGINSKACKHEKNKRAFAQWNRFALCATSNGAEFC